MPKKGRKGRITAVRAHGELALSTLGDNATLGANMFASAVEGSDIYLISGDILLNMKGMAGSEGPILVGCAHDDYTDAEVTENLQADHLDFSDKIEMEKARRVVREWGQFSALDTDEVLNDGKPLRVRFRFRSEEGHNVKIWAHNFSGATLTTGAVLGWSGKVYVRKL